MTAQNRTAHLHTAIAAGACLTLGVSAAAALGVVPHGDGTTTLGARPVAVAGAVAHHPAGHVATRGAAVPLRRAGALHTVRPAAATSSAGHTVVHQHAAGAVTATSTTAGPSGNDSGRQNSPAASSTRPAPQPARHHHHHKRHHHHHHHHAAAKHSHQIKRPQPRTHPSSAAVAQAVAGLKNYVHTIFKPTAAQVAEFGDMVCTALDQHSTVAKIKATILQKVKQLPFTTVLPGAADYVVRTAVKLYCGGYSPLVDGS
ncbi:MAG TPA: hypothetical protein VG708_07375 [Mycobacteriales bacterium]|nr:hypothetical protein [Mycobacteriales bacterium]